jgi:hypothetical protein
MTELEVSKLEIAREYLDAAIEFFLARKNLFCAIHLAAAAEELFGAHLLKSDEESDERIFTLAWKAQKALISETRPTPIDGPVGASLAAVTHRTFTTRTH